MQQNGKRTFWFNG